MQHVMGVSKRHTSPAARLHPGCCGRRYAGDPSFGAGAAPPPLLLRNLAALAGRGLVLDVHGGVEVPGGIEASSQQCSSARCPVSDHPAVLSARAGFFTHWATRLCRPNRLSYSI